MSTAAKPVSTSPTYAPAQTEAAEPPVVTRLPRPDYDAHPAYGGAFPPASLTLRLKALGRLLPWMGFVAVKRALQLDTLPNLADTSALYGRGLAARALLAPRYVPLIVAGLARRAWRGVTGWRPRPPAGSAGQLYERFTRDGIAAIKLRPGELQSIVDELQKPVAELLRRREKLQARSFETNQLWLKGGEYERLQQRLSTLLEEHGVFATASAYLGRPVTIRDMLLQINDPHDAFQHNKFADVGIPDAATNYMHVDTSTGMLKCAIYLVPVSRATGPFSYVRGTNRIPVGSFEAIVRRANDRAGTSGHSRDARQLFMALPKVFRMKCTFGADLLDDTEESRVLLQNEYFFTSADGELGLFDNVGIHRGALVQEGERRVLFLTLA